MTWPARHRTGIQERSSAACRDFEYAWLVAVAPDTAFTSAECAFVARAFNKGIASEVISSEIRSVAFHVADAPHNDPSASTNAVAVTVPKDFAPQSICASGPTIAAVPQSNGTDGVGAGVVVVSFRAFTPVVSTEAALPPQDAAPTIETREETP